jgi:hypothetical protein
MSAFSRFYRFSRVPRRRERKKEIFAFRRGRDKRDKRGKPTFGGSALAPAGLPQPAATPFESAATDPGVAPRPPFLPQGAPLMRCSAPKAGDRKEGCSASAAPATGLPSAARPRRWRSPSRSWARARFSRFRVEAARKRRPRSAPACSTHSAARACPRKEGLKPSPSVVRMARLRRWMEARSR